MWSRGQWIGPTCECGVCEGSVTRRGYDENGGRRKTASDRSLQWDKLGVRVCVFLLSQYVTFLHAAVSSCYHSTSQFSTLHCPVIIIITAIGLSQGGIGYFTCTQIRKKVTRKFKSGGLHERHVAATWKRGNHLSIRL